MNFSSMTVGEVLPKGFDVTRNLKAGVTVQAASFGVSVVRGINPSPGDMVSGSALIDGPRVSNKIAALVPGYYEVRATIQTSDGNVYIERGTLEVVA